MPCSASFSYSNLANKNVALYIHIPWCLKRCPYCDFYSKVAVGHLPEKAYIYALLSDLKLELRLLSPRQYLALDSIFIGGGTPSLIAPKWIDYLLTNIDQLIPITANTEITLEANPGTIETARFACYQASGINRISIGVQSFQDDTLIKLGRIHSAKEAIDGVKVAIKQKLNVNIDLMYGLPAQSTASAVADLQQAIALDPQHISWYQLTIEPSTKFYTNPPSELPDDELSWHIFNKGQKLLVSAGYQQYEVAAWAKPKYECQHNLNYWRFGDYLGIGCGSHGKITNPNNSIVRTIKTKQLNAYIKGQTVRQHAVVPKSELAFEFFLNRLRLFTPIAKNEFIQLTNLKLQDILPAITKAKAQGLIIEDSNYWHITSKGQLFTNDLLTLFIN